MSSGRSSMTTGESTKSSTSGTEDDEDVELEEEGRHNSKGKLQRRTMELTTEEVKKFISQELQQHLEKSIKKSLETALEQLKEENIRNADTATLNRTLKPLQTRSHSTPNAIIKLDEELDPELAQEEDDEEYQSCPSANEPIAMTLIVLQTSLIILYAFFVNYDEENVSGKGKNETNEMGPSHASVELGQYYPQFQDIQIMIFLGIGVLMSFLKKYGYSAIGFSLLAGTFAVQWSILVRGMINNTGNMISLNIVSLIFGDFAAAVVLISYGVIIGVSTPLQLVFMTFSEVVFYWTNEYIGATLFRAVDTGGSMFVHIFAAYFGMGVSKGMMSAKDVNTKNLGTSYNSNIFCLVAVVFLWIFWPSFNCILSSGVDQHRVVINTILSLFASCILAFATSALFNRNKFIISHIQNASLAGGVAVGAVVDMMIRPFGALAIGAVGGFLCVLGCQFVSPFLTKRLGLHDSCGVHNLHGIPGLFAALTGVVMAAVASECDYGHNLYLRYPARAPLANTSQLLQLQQLNPTIVAGLNRTGNEQALYQLSALCVTILISLVGGAFTGLLMRLPIFGKVKMERSFEDVVYFEGADEDAMTPGPPQPALTSKVSPKPLQITAAKHNGISIISDPRLENNRNLSPQIIKRRTKYEL